MKWSKERTPDRQVQTLGGKAESPRALSKDGLLGKMVCYVDSLGMVRKPPGGGGIQLGETVEPTGNTVKTELVSSRGVLTPAGRLIYPTS